MGRLERTSGRLETEVGALLQATGRASVASEENFLFAGKPQPLPLRLSTDWTGPTHAMGVTGYLPRLQNTSEETMPYVGPNWHVDT